MIDDPVQDEQIHRLQYAFSGSWQPDLHPLKIIGDNFANVQNIDYTKTGILGSKGYTKINTTALSSYPQGRLGFQLRSPHTQNSYIFTRQVEPVSGTSVIYQSNALPPATGEFEAVPFHADAVGANGGSFAEVPDNNMIYSNGVETLIYGGEEAHIAAFIFADSITGLSPVNPIVYTDQLRNTSIAEYVVLTAGSTHIIGSTRPLAGIKPYILVGNTVSSSVTIKYWGTSGWTSATGLVDGTRIAGISYAQTGEILFNSTVDIAKTNVLCGNLFYWYTVELSAGSATLYHVTTNQPKQKVVDLWDGINRVCIQCQICRSGVYENYTNEVVDTSVTIYPIAAKFAGIVNTDHAILMFSERTTAIKVTFIGGLTNIHDNDLILATWDGSAWVDKTTVYDGTTSTDTGYAMGQNGTIYWDPPDEADEHKVTLFGIFGYAYKLRWSATLTNDSLDDYTEGCYVDTIYGIPATRTMGAYNFAFMYKNRTFLVGDLSGKEGHCIDYSPKDMADCFNGSESSADGKRLYVGKNSSSIIAAQNVFNRFGSNIYNSEIILKPTETYLLDGNGPSDFTISQVSDNIGTQAPNTLCAAEVAFEVTKEAIRNIALWVSNTGPVMFDAAVLVPIKGVDLYFDRTKDTCVNFNSMDSAHSWFDANTYLWNVCLPVGTDQILCNTWLAYDLIEKKWTKRDVGEQYIPQAAFKVVDEYGNIYYYGLLENGYMVQLENGVLWNDELAIESSVLTNMILPTGSLLDITTLLNLTFITEGSGDYDIKYTRSDISINGPSITSGYLNVYGEVIEDDSCTAVYWSGDDFICKSITENVAGLVDNWLDVDGDVSIRYTIVEHYAMEIETIAGNFITAGFISGLIIYTTDTNNPGPFLCTTVTSTIMTFDTGRATSFAPGTAITISSVFASVEYYLNGSNTPVPLTVSKVDIFDTMNQFKFICNGTGLCHQFKFKFYSNAIQDNIKPIAWSAQYLIERENI